ncbi:MAG: hypothetical protein ACRD68_06375 [Pyrinomonadaceae bacterium]
MKDEHVIDILESAPFAGLGESELASVRAHAARCPECRRAYDAARVSSLLLKERAAAGIEPSPFFQTRVMAALRERQAANEAWSFGRLWRAAGALVSGMAATVALLAGLTFLSPVTQTNDDLAVTASPYAAEEVVIAPDDLSNGEMTYEQVLTTIYESGEDEAR